HAARREPDPRARPPPRPGRPQPPARARAPRLGRGRRGRVTVAPHGPRLAPQTLEEAVAALRERGIRVTRAPRLVRQGLVAAHQPVTAEQLAGGLDGAVPPSDLASTYRNLEALERLGLVRHVHLGHGPGLYERAGAPEREYLVCEGCGTIRSVDA